ncbi:MAG: sporulation protein YqfD [Oscillospiraceae bacterium]|nr:sporulation protein YqfD [Oscillospiraceae bacterium]
MKIREFCDIQAEGRNLYPFVNAIRNSMIACGNQYCKNNIFYCRIAEKDLTDLKKLAQTYHIILHIQPQPSFMRKLKNYKFRFGILLGLLLSVAVIFYYSNTVAVIEIQGAETVKDSVILSLLEQENVHIGTWITDIDMNHCETLLRLKIPEVAWAGIRHAGNRLVIQITEETPQIPMVQERIPCHIISKYNAQITDVRIYNGQLLHLIGDGVSAGEILVSGEIQNENHPVRYCHALGSITGIYTQTAELTEYFTSQKTTHTGKRVIQKWFQLFNLQIPLQLSQPNFSEFTVKEFYTPYQFSGHTLPAGIFRRITTEKHTAVTQHSEEEVLSSLNAAIVRYEKNFLSNHTEILNCQKQYTTDENGITCHLTYTLKGEIGTTSEFYIIK